MCTALERFRLYLLTIWGNSSMLRVKVAASDLCLNSSKHLKHTLTVVNPGNQAVIPIQHSFYHSATRVINRLPVQLVDTKSG